MNILLITQTLPSETGLGAAMRVGNFVESLSRHHTVTLLVVSADDTVREESFEDRWRSMCVRVVVLNVAAAAMRCANPSVLARLLEPEPKLLARWPVADVLQGLAGLAGQEYDAVLVVRLRLLPIWRLLEEKLRVRTDRKILDLDDIESRSQARQVRMLGTGRLGKLGFVLEWLEAKKLAKAEVAAGRSMEKLLVCSDGDRDELARRLGEGKVAVVPNCIRLPDQLPTAERSDVFRLMFVGALDYAPNEDAVRWLAGGILPELARRSGRRAVRLSVVGRRPPAWMRREAEAGRFDLCADVPEMASHYAKCDAVVVPIRSGGGTRIKILEAFGYGRPVVSTTVGAEGIHVAHGEELLLADDAACFAESITRLARDAHLADRLVRQARKRVEMDYSLVNFGSTLAGVLG